ncbi:MAG: MFS transporter [Acidobacteria bacterium]|nr:MFS transporter [Acidobacteriota bacterium]
MKNKWAVLIAGILMQLILGGIYAWSVFVPSLKDNYGFSGTQTGLIFGITIGVFTLAMLFAGRLLDSKGPRLTSFIGAILYIIGHLVASFSSGSFPILVLGIGVLVGAGIGFGYVCPLATSMKWFPKHKGLVSGIAVAGFGGGAALLSKIVAKMLANNVEVLKIFLYIALVPGAILLVSALIMANPDTTKKNEKKKEKIELKEIIFQPRFNLLFAGMLAGTFGGLLVIGNLKPMGLAAGISTSAATIAIAVLSLSNAAGRIIWGAVQDRIGRLAISIKLILLGIGVLPLLVNGSSFMFLLGAGLTGFMFGGCFVLYAAQVAGRYGTEYFGTIYPIVFLSYGFSGILGPVAGGKIFDLTGSYSIAVYICAALAIGMGIIFLLLDNKFRKSE